MTTAARLSTSPVSRCQRFAPIHSPQEPGARQPKSRRRPPAALAVRGRAR
jgi:hypothetical protein